MTPNWAAAALRYFLKLLGDTYDIELVQLDREDPSNLSKARRLGIDELEAYIRGFAGETAREVRRK